jgi:hypothetical protein
MIVFVGSQRVDNSIQQQYEEDGRNEVDGQSMFLILQMIHDPLFSEETLSLLFPPVLVVVE